MKILVKIGVLALLMTGLMGTERAFAQGRIPIPTGPAPGTAHPAAGHGYGGGYGYGYGGGFGGIRNLYNPFNPYSPYNPLSPYSPYNPISPVSPYYNPFNAGAYSAMYLYNPLYNPGLLSRNPAVQLSAWTYATAASTNLNSYTNYYASAYQNQLAAANNAQAQAALNQQYVNAQTLTAQAYYLAAMAQQSKQNPYAQPPGPGMATPPPQPPPSKYNSGFTGSTSSGYDSFLNTGVSPSYGSTEQRPTKFETKFVPPTYTEAQIRIQADRLVRIQQASSPGEIVSGFAQNELIKDIQKFIGLQAAMPPLMLQEDTLRELNVIKDGQGNLGAIRVDGKITWPVALGYVLSKDDQRKLEETITRAIEAAQKDKIDANSLISMTKQIDDIRDKLAKKVNDIPTPDYLQSKRFLNDLENARLGLQNGEWATHIKYEKFIAGGKSVQDLAKYMVESGLRFAPATGHDEGSYKALYAALVAYDLQLHAQFAPQIAKE